jgi:nucleotide-binding universal stress UspA family protein
MIEESRQFGMRLGLSIRGEVRVAPNAEQEILNFAVTEGMDVVVLGTSSRPVTDRPFFGHRISYIAENSPLPVVMVALPSFRGGG